MKQFLSIIDLLIASLVALALMQLLLPLTAHSAEKPECPTHYHDDNSWASPRWEELTPEQVKKCMQQYWKEQVDKSGQFLSDSQKNLGDAQYHWGMWQ